MQLASVEGMQAHLFSNSTMERLKGKAFIQRMNNAQLAAEVNLNFKKDLPLFT